MYVHGTPGNAGASNSLSYLIHSMVTSGHEISIICPPGEAFEQFSAIPGTQMLEGGELPITATAAGLDHPVLRSIYGHATYFRNYRYFHKYINQLRPDIVHLNDVGMGYGAKIAKMYGVKVVMHVRLVLNSQNRLYKRVTNYFIRNYVDAIISIDRSAHKQITNAVAKHIVHNPISNHANKRKPPAKNSKTTLKVLFLANLLPYKGIYEFLKIADQLKNVPEIEFIIAGGNSRPPAVYKTRVGRLLSILGIYKDNVEEVQKIIKTNHLSNVEYRGFIKDIDKLFSEVHLLLLPSFMNQPSRCVYEAALYYIPTIITMRDKVEDVIMHGKTGYIFEEGKIHDMANQLKYLQHNFKKIEELGKAACDKIIDQHDVNSANVQTSSIYKSLVAR